MPESDRDKLLGACQEVLKITRDMVATIDLDELLGLIISGSMKLLEAERATLFLYDEATDELFSRIAHGAEEIRMPADAGIAGAVARGKQVLNIPDAYADERFNREVDRKTGFRTRNMLAVPLLDHNGQLVGVLEVLNRRGGGFSGQDVTLAETLAAQAGVVLQRARLLAHYVEKQRMEQALAIAREIQQGLLPREDPRIEGFDVAGASWPADETGGDIYDFFDLGGGRWALMLADATGHGVGPALVIAEARAMLRALSPCPGDPRGAGGELDQPGILSILGRVNDLLAVDLDSARFVTCFFGVLDSAGGTVRYASAGQGPILFYDRTGDRFDEMAATALPLGVMEGAEFSEQVRRELAAGDMLVLLTDGFFEAANAADEQFGVGRVREVLRRARDLPAAGIIRSLRQAVSDFTGAAPQADDLTAIVVKRA